MVFDPYMSGVLDKEIHSRLVQDIDNIAATAAIQPEWICHPLEDSVTPLTLSWVKGFHRRIHGGCSGLVLKGRRYDFAARNVSAIAGALLRNFVNAQVVTTQNLYSLLKRGEAPDPTCLLIPEFFYRDI